MGAAFKELTLQSRRRAYGYVRVTEVLLLHPAQMTGKKMSTIDEGICSIGNGIYKKNNFHTHKFVDIDVVILTY